VVEPRVVAEDTMVLKLADENSWTDADLAGDVSEFEG
jgi:hypothetical protein